VVIVSLAGANGKLPPDLLLPYMQKKTRRPAGFSV
jgi:hypothetical protein